MLHRIKQFELALFVICLTFLLRSAPTDSIFAATAYQRCKSGTTCVVGEYLYDDAYSPITSATCTFSSRNPDGTVFINAAAMTPAAQNDGWYSYSVDTTGKDDGVYRSQVCCTSGSEYMCLDKTYEIGASFISETEVTSAVWDASVAGHNTAGTFGTNLQVAAPTTTQIWNAPDRSLTDFGTLISDMWNYSTRSLSSVSNIATAVWSAVTRTLTAGTLDSGTLALQSDVTSATSTITSNDDSNTTTLGTAISGVQTTANTIDGKVDTLTTNLSTVATNVSTVNSTVNTINGKADTINTAVLGVQTTANTINGTVNTIDTNVDTLLTNLGTLSTTVGTIATDVTTIKNKWGAYSASDIISSVSTLQTNIGSSSDGCAATTLYGYAHCAKDKWGISAASDLLSATNAVASTADSLRTELNYNGKSTTAYEDLQTLLTNLGTVSTNLGTVSTNVSTIASNVTTIGSQLTTLISTVNTLSSSVTGIGTNVSTLLSKWGSYSMSDVMTEVSGIQTKLGTTSNTCLDATVFGYLTCIEDAGGGGGSDAAILAAATTAATQSTALRAELDYNGKSTTAYADLQALKTTMTTLQSLIGSSSDTAAATTLFGSIKQTQADIATLDSSGASLTELLDKWGSYSASDIYDKVKDLASKIEAVNTVTNVASILTLSQTNATNMASLKNSVLELSALTNVNKTILMNGKNAPITISWFEEGSIILKTMIFNPSNITQDIPVKIYLPKEASVKDIIKIDPSLSTTYDEKQQAYFVTGSYTLTPGQTKIVAVEMTDIWKISAQDIAALKRQTSELYEPLKSTNKFTDAAALFSEILAALDSAIEVQAQAQTPEARIIAYRSALENVELSKSKLQTMQSMVKSSYSPSGVDSWTSWGKNAAMGLLGIGSLGIVFLGIRHGLKLRQKSISGMPKKSVSNQVSQVNKIVRNVQPVSVRFSSTLLMLIGGYVGTLLMSCLLTIVLVQHPLKLELAKFQPVISWMNTIQMPNVTVPKMNLPIPSSSSTEFSSPSPIPPQNLTSITTPTQKVLGAQTDQSLVKIKVLGKGVNARAIASSSAEIVKIFYQDTTAKKIGSDKGWIHVVNDPALQSGVPFDAWVSQEFIENSW